MVSKAKEKTPKYFTKEELALAKKLAYENSEESGIGFVFRDTWITNPFVEETGRFEFMDFASACAHYGKQNVYELITQLLNKPLV